MAFDDPALRRAPSSGPNRQPRDDQPCIRARGSRFGRCAVVAAPAILAACEPGVLHPQGPVGSADATIMIDSLAIMLAIVVPTIAAILGFAWWFRASNRQSTYRPDFAESGRLEL